MTPRRVAVIGAGPVGLAMALAAADAGEDVHVYDAGRVGEHLRRFAGIPLFTPFAMNSTPETRERLRRAGVSLPEDEALLTAGSLVERYLEPMAALPELQGRLHADSRIDAVAREGTGFLLRVLSPDGSRFEEADQVVDASGVVSRPLRTGPGGIAAIGEEDLGERVDRHLPASRDCVRARFRGRCVLLVGSGHSAATALVELDALAREGEGPAHVEWVHREREAGVPFAERPGDPLPARASLERRANGIAAGRAWLTRRPGSVVLAYETLGDGSLRVGLRAQGGMAASVEVDRVLALVGYRPDTDLFRELSVHLCYESEGPMALAAALLASRAADPSRAGDCLAQTTHGPETLRTTEPGFFVIGAKSYGRNPDFLMRVGYEQVRDAAELLAAGRPGRMAGVQV